MYHGVNRDVHLHPLLFLFLPNVLLLNAVAKAVTVLHFVRHYSLNWILKLYDNITERLIGAVCSMI